MTTRAFWGIKNVLLGSLVFCFGMIVGLSAVFSVGSSDEASQGENLGNVSKRKLGFSKEAESRAKKPRGSGSLEEGGAEKELGHSPSNSAGSDRSRLAEVYDRTYADARADTSFKLLMRERSILETFLRLFVPQFKEGACGRAGDHS